MNKIQRGEISSLLKVDTDASKMEVDNVNFFLRKRYWVSFLTCFGWTFILILRTNLSIALVDMTFDKNITVGNETLFQKAEFDWDSPKKGFIISLYAFGYFFGPIGGMLAMTFGGASIFGLGVGAVSLLTVLTPFLLRTNFVLFVAARIAEGAFGSCSVACNSDIFVHWAPPNERSRLVLFSVSGAYLGGMLNYPLSGIVAHKYGWEAVFYITGGAGLIWYALWFTFVTNNPVEDRLMTKNEREFFKSFIPYQKEKKKITYPWRKIFTSKPSWAYVNEYFSFSWSYSFLMYCLPLYIKDVYNVDVESIGLISAIPIFAAWLGLLVAAVLSDILRTRGTFNKPMLHRIFIGTGQICCVIFMVIIGYWANFVESIICLSLTRFFLGFAEMSYYVLVIDMFYEYAALMRGFAVTFSGSANFLNPVIMGLMVADHSRSSWNSYFLFLCIFNLWSLLIYFLYGSGELQEWAKPVDEAKEEN